MIDPIGTRRLESTPVSLSNTMVSLRVFDPSLSVFGDVPILGMEDSEKQRAENQHTKMYNVYLRVYPVNLNPIRLNLNSM